MRAIVDEETCIGCGRCVEICPEVFELEGELAVNKIGEGNDIPPQYEQPCKKLPANVPLKQ